MGDLRAEHFFLGDHAVIFAELMAQLNAGKSVDVISLMVSLEGRIKDAGAYLNAMAQSTPSSANIGRYASIVRDKAVKRGLIEFGKELAEEGFASPFESSVLLDVATSKLGKLAEARIRQEPIKAADDLPNHIGEMQNRLEGGSKPIPTGFADIDRKLSGGIRRGQLIVLAARPAMGKTALSLNIAANVASDYSSLLLSMEMPRSELHDRNISSLGKLPLDHVMRPSEETDWDRVTAAVSRIQDLNLFLDDQGGLRLLDVRMKAKQVKRKHGLDLLVIDYLQLMEGEGDNRNAQIEGITRGLKALAKELEIGIVLLSQLNRNLESRPNKRPQMSDLRDSGSIEQDADVVLFLYRDEVYNPDSPDKGIAEAIFAKVRQGAIGTVALTFIGEQTRFEDCARWVQRAPEDRRQTARRGLAEHL
jgi:replicative DNA helicase